MPYTLVTLVQTDKSKYKAGQEVLFRVVTLKSDLTAQEETVSTLFSHYFPVYPNNVTTTSELLPASIFCLIGPKSF